MTAKAAAGSVSAASTRFQAVALKTTSGLARARRALTAPSSVTSISARSPAHATSAPKRGDELAPELPGRADDDGPHAPIASASAKSRAVSPPASWVLSTSVTFE